MALPMPVYLGGVNMKIFSGLGIIDGEGVLLRHNAIVSNEGKIIEVTSIKEGVGKYPDAQLINYNGFIYPGFIDCHIHLTGTGVDMLSVDCRKTKSLAKLFSLIQNRVDEISETDILFCAYFDPDTYEEKAYPTLETLDALFPYTPIFISHIECHGGIVNSRFLRVMGQAIEHKNGLVVGENNSKVRQFLFNSLSEDYKLKGIKLAEKEAIKQGITTIHAMEGGQLFSDKDVDLLLKKQNELSVNLVIYHQTLNVDKVIYSGLKQIGGCVLIDGSSGVYTAALSDPYEGKKTERGLLYYTKEEIISFLLNAQKNGLQVALHCCGDRALDFLFDCYEDVNKIHSILGFRHRIEHFEIPRPDQIKRCKELGLILSMQPSFDYFWGGPNRDYFNTLGERWKWTNPIGKVFEAGVMVGGGSDSGVTPISPLLGIHSAVNHSNPEQRISVSQGIQMFTKNAAYLSFEDKIKGDVKIGFNTDLTILDKNLLNIAPNDIKDVKVIDTVISGKSHNSM